LTAAADFRPELGAVFDFSRRTKLRISGADRLRYLNGQITNDLRKAASDVTIHACVLNAKGKINADVFIRADADSFLIDSDPEMREQLAARLERYVIADDVLIEDISDAFALFHVIGGDATTFVKGKTAARAERFGLAGTDIWVGSDEHDAMLQELTARFLVCDAECAETFRIERGIPRWGHELTEEIIPTEANLEVGAIDYAKGCYIGQEVISRIKMSGQTNKRLCGFVATSATPLTSGMRLTSFGPEPKEVGWLTSAATSARLNRQIALGFVKRGFQEIGTRFSVSSEGVVEIVPLPFV
jgi:folate-binding protein YgfZ